MAETRGEAREGGNVKVEREVETEIQIGKDDEGGESIEMRTARDAKAVPSRGVGVGVGVPLEHHLTPDQLANLTLESRRIKVMHTNLIPKHLPNKNPNFEKHEREKPQIYKLKSSGVERTLRFPRVVLKFVQREFTNLPSMGPRQHHPPQSQCSDGEKVDRKFFCVQILT